MDTAQSTPPAALAWQQCCLGRLHRLLELTPEAPPPAWSEAEAFALLEWCRIAVFTDCHDAGVGATAMSMLRGRQASRSS